MYIGPLSIHEPKETDTSYSVSKVFQTLKALATVDLGGKCVAASRHITKKTSVAGTSPCSQATGVNKSVHFKSDFFPWDYMLCV